MLARCALQHGSVRGGSQARLHGADLPRELVYEAVVDLITHKAHIIDIGTESWRFRHGLGRRAGRRKK